MNDDRRPTGTDRPRVRTTAGLILRARARWHVRGLGPAALHMTGWRTIDWDAAARSGATIRSARRASGYVRMNAWGLVAAPAVGFVAALTVASTGCPPALLDRFCDQGGDPEFAVETLREGLADRTVAWHLYRRFGTELVLHTKLVVTAVTLRLVATGMTVQQATGWADGLGATLLDRAGQEPNWDDAAETETELLAWVRTLGPDRWTAVASWEAAGYTPEQTVALLGLPETHPDRPGPDQLTVMAALRGVPGTGGAC